MVIWLINGTAVSFVKDEQAKAADRLEPKGVQPDIPKNVNSKQKKRSAEGILKGDDECYQGADSQGGEGRRRKK